MTKSRKVETVTVDVFIGRMVQHIMPKGFQRVRYYGLQATKTFEKWSAVIRKGMKALGRKVKGVYQVVKAKRYRERYMEISSQDPFLCRYEMKVNEAIIDVEIAKAEFEGRNIAGFMPVLGCPGCNQETMKYAEGRKPVR